MGRNKSRPRALDQATTRIIWRDGPFRVECVGAAAKMTLSVYDGRFVLAEETVESAEMAWRRGTELCRQLEVRELAGQRGSA
jgi:hypothetical protein